MFDENYNYKEGAKYYGRPAFREGGTINRGNMQHTGLISMALEIATVIRSRVEDCSLR